MVGLRAVFEAALLRASLARAAADVARASAASVLPISFIGKFVDWRFLDLDCSR